MFPNVSADLARACVVNQHEEGVGPLVREVLGNPGTQAVLVYRLGAWIESVRVPGVRQLLKVCYFPIQYVMGFRVGIFIPPQATIGPGLVIHTWGGGIFLPRTQIGKNVTIVGGGVQMDYDMAGIGDDVDIGPGTKIIGSIRLGNQVRTAPNSVVQADVPDSCIVIGNPGRVIGPVPKLTFDQSQTRTVPKTTSRRKMDGSSNGADASTAKTGSSV
ncbi:MAG: serine O-acetyltransferase [Longimicrobiales bacterium]